MKRKLPFCRGCEVFYAGMLQILIPRQIVFCFWVQSLEEVHLNYLVQPPRLIIRMR